ncbi:hypothetical protein [Yoonia sp. 208BN28-4]|uniref:hypothetical protein n=1 Tax=Yoonia sp. 208BN28-4 TaxID=3126505 RepID=UPI0030AC0BB2
MIRAGLIIGCLAVMAGCSGPTLGPPDLTGDFPTVTVVVPNSSDGDAVPLAVIQNLPAGVSATSVVETDGCFSYGAGDGLVPVNNPDGIQICRA